jgi:hypothetical protein
MTSKVTVTPAELTDRPRERRSGERLQPTLHDLVVELARIAAAEDDAAERRQDVATPCVTR